MNDNDLDSLVALFDEQAGDPKDSDLSAVSGFHELSDTDRQNLVDNWQDVQEVVDAIDTYLADPDHYLKSLPGGKRKDLLTQLRAAMPAVAPAPVVAPAPAGIVAPAAANPAPAATAAAPAAASPPSPVPAMSLAAALALPTVKAQRDARTTVAIASPARGARTAAPAANAASSRNAGAVAAPAATAQPHARGGRQPRDHDRDRDGRRPRRAEIVHAPPPEKQLPNTTVAQRRILEMPEWQTERINLEMFFTLARTMDQHALAQIKGITEYHEQILRSRSQLQDKKLRTRYVLNLLNALSDRMDERDNDRYKELFVDGKSRETSAIATPAQT